MVLIFHMQHHQSAGLYSGKIQSGWESKTAADTKKIARPLKSTFSPEWLGMFGWNFVWCIIGTLGFIVIKMRKKSIAELGHSDRLKNYVGPFKIYSDLMAFKSISPEWLDIFGWNFVWYCILVWSDIKIKKSVEEFCHSDRLKPRLAKRREILIFPRTVGNTGNSRELLENR